MIISLLLGRAGDGYYASEEYTLIWLSYSSDRRVSAFKPVIALPPLLSKCLVPTDLPIRHLAYLSFPTPPTWSERWATSKDQPPTSLSPSVHWSGTKLRPLLSRSTQCPCFLPSKVSDVYMIAGLSPYEIRLVLASTRHLLLVPRRPLAPVTRPQLSRR